MIRPLYDSAVMTGQKKENPAVIGLGGLGGVSVEDASMAQLRNSVTATQCTRVLEWLALGKPLTAEIAKNAMGIARLAARVQDLRDQGNVIHTKIITVRNRFGQKCRVAEYSLLRTAQGVAV
jgi:hypothetical protein